MYCLPHAKLDRAPEHLRVIVVAREKNIIDKGMQSDLATEIAQPGPFSYKWIGCD